jgi:hypothetical protein
LLFWLQQNDTAIFSYRGIIALDDVLIEKSGEPIEDVDLCLIFSGDQN